MKHTIHRPQEVPMKIWQQHFKTILNQSLPKKEEVRNNPPITCAEIENVLKNTKNKKAAGPDGIYYERLKEAKDVIIEPLMELYNKCLDVGTILDIWRNSQIKVLYKGKGDPADPNAYRGIALEDTMFKLPTKILSDRLRTIVDPLIPENQFGFRPQRSATQAIATLLAATEEALRLPGGKFHIIFIDYSKAFDLLDRNLVIRKLR